jgi:hypothetical protein
LANVILVFRQIGEIPAVVRQLANMITEKILVIDECHSSISPILRKMYVIEPEYNALYEHLLFM